MEYDWSELIRNKRRLRRALVAIGIFALAGVPAAAFVRGNVIPMFAMPLIFFISLFVWWSGTQLSDTKCPCCGKGFFVPDIEGFSLKKNFPNVQREECVNCGVQFQADSEPTQPPEITAEQKP